MKRKTKARANTKGNTRATSKSKTKGKTRKGTNGGNKNATTSSSSNSSTCTSINIHELKMIIHNQTKRSLTNVPLYVDKKTIYFGTNGNWKINFDSLHDGIKTQVDDLLDSLNDDNEHDNDHGNGNGNGNLDNEFESENDYQFNRDSYEYPCRNQYDHEYENNTQELIFQSTKQSKSFHCYFDLSMSMSSSTSSVPSIRQRQKQSFIDFLHQFQRIHDKWESKHTKKLQEQHQSHHHQSLMDMDSSSFDDGHGHGRGRTLKSYGRVSTSTRNTRDSYGSRTRTPTTAVTMGSSSSSSSSSRNKSRTKKGYGRSTFFQEKIVDLKQNINDDIVNMDDEEGDYDNNHNGRNTSMNTNARNKASNESNVCSLDEDDFDTDKAISSTHDVEDGHDLIADESDNEFDHTYDDDDGNNADEKNKKGNSASGRRASTSTPQQGKRKNAQLLSSSRRLKKVRTTLKDDIEEDDSDIDFDTDIVTQKKSPSSQIFNDDDDNDINVDTNPDDDDDNDDIVELKSIDIPKSPSKQTKGDNDTRGTPTATFQKTIPAVAVSPIHPSNTERNDSINAPPQDVLSDAVTDDDRDRDESMLTPTSASIEDKIIDSMTSITSFFQPKSLLSDTISNKKTSNNDIKKDNKTTNKRDEDNNNDCDNHVIDHLEKDVKKSPMSNRRSKYFMASGDDTKISSADHALSLPSQKTPKLLTANASPKSRPKGSPRVLKLSPVSKSIKNPYKNDTKERSSHIGLRNLGNTCYLNSSLQMIFSVPNFISGLQNIYDKFSKERTVNDEKTTTLMPLTKAFLKVAWDAKIVSTPDVITNPSTMTSVDPYDLKEAIDVITDKFKGYEQRDAHEFASALIDYIHDELMKEKKDEDTLLPTDEYFRMNVKVCLTCDSCNYTRSKEELYRHLSIELGKNKDAEAPWTVNQSLEQFFVPEVREIRCEKCKSGLTATQTIQVMSRPKALLLHLKRFIVNDATRSFQKNKARIIYDKSLSLDKFCSLKSKNNNSGHYNLRGVVRHIGGTASSGHYTANCERWKKKESEGKENNEEWVSFDDGMAYPTSMRSVLESERNQRTAYMMMYAM